MPIDRRLIKPDMLTAEETRWLDRYHARVAATAVSAFAATAAITPG